MDGNEKELSARREGIGDISSSGRAGAVRETPKGLNKRSITSLVTPIERNGDLSTAVENGAKSIARVQRKTGTEIKRKSENNSSFGSMMQRMKEGLPPDERSMEESTDEEELEAYLAQWRDDDGELDSETGMTDDEQNQNEAKDNNGLDDFDSEIMTDDGQKSDENMDNTEFKGNGLKTSGDFGKANDFTRASSLTKSRNLIATDVMKNGTSWQDRTKGRERNNKENTDTNNKEDRITDVEGPDRNETKTDNRQDQENTENADTNTREVRFMDEEGLDKNQTKTAKVRSLGIATGRAAKEMGMGTEALKVGPGLVNTPEVMAPTQKMYTYNTQLSVRYPLGAKKGNYNVPSCFKQVIQQLHALSPAITLLPYNTNGVPITNADQLPDNEIEDYIIYYHNHQVTAGGQLTGMCCIEAPFAWHQLKDEKKTLFKWLREKGVFMKYVSFKADLVSAAGWFYGMNPDVLKKDEVKAELTKRLGLTLSEDLSFQMVPRMLSITDKITRNRFSFKGVAIECDRGRVKELQEALYGMDSPAKAKFVYGITGGTLFVPFVENDVWKNDKILGMAKAHVQEMNKLGQIFLQNVQDIDKPLKWTDGDEESLRTMLTNCFTIDGHKMVHSIHNTNRAGTITILYYKEYATEVNNTFPDIQEILERQLEVESKGMLATEGNRIIMTGRQSHVMGSEASKEYASYADIILAGMNPQGGDDAGEELIITSPPRKKQAQRRTPPRMTYSQITEPKRNGEVSPMRKNNKPNTHSRQNSGTSDSEDSPDPVPPKEKDTLVSNLQERLNKMQEQFESQFGQMEGTDIATTNQLIKENNKKMQKISEEYFEKKFQELSVNLTKEIQKSNDLIFDKFAALNAQQNTALLSLQEAMKQELQKVYTNMANLQAGKPIIITELQTLGTVARPGGLPQASDGRT